VHKVLAYTIGVLLLSQSMNVHIGELAQLDDFVEHAQYHQKEYGDDWFTFIKKHLGSDKERHLQQDHPDKHEKLPQHDHLCSNVLPLVILQDKVAFNILKQNKQVGKTTFHYLEDYSFLAQKDFFQPPRFA
jgi:hypothetical protein